MTTPVAWQPMDLRAVSLPNRVWLSPMCQYSADGSGVPGDWHLAHYGARAAAGVGMVVVECTGVAPDMRTTAHDLGLWNDDQVDGHRRLTGLIRSLGSIPAVQLGVAGRKSSHGVPWDNAGTRSPVTPEHGGWQPLAPSAIPFAGLAVPREMTAQDGARVLADLERASRNARRAGYEVLELHGANGYLFHQFLSPLANVRTDRWGGDLDARMGFPLAMIDAIRRGWPDDGPLLLRMPATDLLEGGLTLEEAVVVAVEAQGLGVDMIDLESGTLIPEAPRIDVPLHNAQYGPCFRAAGLRTSASGAVTATSHLDEAIPGMVDAVLVGRAILRDPYWALRVRGGDPRESWPRQYHRAF